VQDYYAFGMQMPGRKSSGGYRYGFNGKENDNEVKGEGNQQDYGMRIYDGRIGKFLSVDPLASKFPWQSPYCAMDNNPILKNDPTGASGEVTINKQSKTITVSANLIFYGEAASPALAKQTAADVQNLWNGAKGKTTIDGVEYNVQFNIKGEYRDAYGPIDATMFYFEKGFNDDVKNNFIEVKYKVDGGVSNMIQGGNEGTFQLDNINGTGTTTEAHEFGHSLGLWPGTSDGHPKDGDIRGKGQPGIMYPRGTLVDPKYQYDPNAKAGAKGGTINPNSRKVVQGDIDALGLDKLKYSDGKANLGKSTSSE
jgi:RHS repeat-associated protein